MITGDVASGKSTFANTLAKRLSLPLVNLDQLQKQYDRTKDIKAINQAIIHHASQDQWIIEGNAFKKDLDYRIKNADLIFLFDTNPLTSYQRHLLRWYKSKFHNQPLEGGVTDKLLPIWFAKFIFILWPRRKSEIKKLFVLYNKPVIVFKSYSDVDNWLKNELEW